MHCILERVIVHFSRMKHCGEQTNPIFKLFIAPDSVLDQICLLSFEKRGKPFTIQETKAKQSVDTKSITFV